MYLVLIDDDIPAAAIKAIDTDNIDAFALNCLAIDHSDAIVQATENVDPRLIEYAKASGKPFLPYPGENFKDAYYDFYTSL